MPYVLPIGPRHPALPGPLLLELELSGTSVLDAAVTPGFFRRDLERSCEQGTYAAALGLLDDQCPSCSFSHSLAFCQAVEHLAGIEVPPRARALRVIYAELERIDSHLLWLASLARILSHEALRAQVLTTWRSLRSYLRTATDDERVAGAVVVGGVRRDLDDTLALRQRVESLKRPLDRLILIFLNDVSLAARLSHLGYLTSEMAVAHGVLGPVARAAGLPLDARRQRPYAAYGEVEVRVVTQQTGDVFARAMVRLLEVFESLRLLGDVAARLPEGDLRGDVDVAPPEGECLSWVESPRGEEQLYLVADGGERPLRLHLSTPSERNVDALPTLLPGSDVADVFILTASLDLCVSCIDR